MAQEIIEIVIDPRPAIEGTSRANAAVTEFEVRTAGSLDRTTQAYDRHTANVIRMYDRNRSSMQQTTSAMEQHVKSFERGTESIGRAAIKAAEAVGAVALAHKAWNF